MLPAARRKPLFLHTGLLRSRNIDRDSVLLLLCLLDRSSLCLQPLFQCEVSLRAFPLGDICESMIII